MVSLIIVLQVAQTQAAKKLGQVWTIKGRETTQEYANYRRKQNMNNRSMKTHGDTQKIKR